MEWLRRLIGGDESGGPSAQAKRSRLRCEALEDRSTPSSTGIFAVGAGPGGTPRVKVYDSTSGALIADFFAFEPTFNGGVNVAVGDVNGDGFADVIVGAGAGGGPRIRVLNGAAIRTQGLNYNPSNPGGVIADFFAFESTQRGGAYVASGNFAGTVGGFDDVVIGAGPGGGPRVRILDGQQIAQQGQNFTSNGQNDTIADFFAFESSFRNGVVVAASPPGTGLTTVFANSPPGAFPPATQFSTLAVAPGFGGAPRVRVLRGDAIAMQGLNYTSLGTNDTIADFFAGSPASRAGLFIAMGDIDKDGYPDLITGAGPGDPAEVQIFNGQAMTLQAGHFTGQSPGDKIDDFLVAPTSFYEKGVTVGTAVRSDGPDLLLYGVGGDRLTGRAIVSRYTVGSGFYQRNDLQTLIFDPNFIGGVNVSL